jgi:hypothetical protein
MSRLRNRVYYRVKPFIPQSLRTALRRTLALRLRSGVADVWPIMPGSEQPPENWPGWPEGKKIAVVLTHDVEGQAGLDKCRDLMRLELELGFRSSFNFIPEGDYEVPRELREELTQNGFEVGIHDLKHDGRLFASRREFSQRAVQVNRYLAEWKAVGFRSAFMLHRLDWFHELDIEYDTSTFDTDPFEPEPEGRHTIFPFWVPAPSNQQSAIRDQRSEVRSADGRIRRGENQQSAISNQQSDDIRHSAGRAGGYVELPYTLPQDFTLFLLFREQTIGIWLRKLDWIAQHGGMALVDVHPDYLCFDGSTPGPREYPATHYRSFLEYVRRQYDGAFWNATPREVARFCAGVTKASAASEG